MNLSRVFLESLPDLQIAFHMITKMLPKIWKAFRKKQDKRINYASLLT